MVDPASIVQQGAAAAGFAKVLVDIIKISPIPSPGTIVPVLALLFSEAAAFLLGMANGVTFDHPTIALTILVGVAATAGTIGITAAQNKANGS